MMSITTEVQGLQARKLFNPSQTWTRQIQSNFTNIIFYKQETIRLSYLSCAINTGPHNVTKAAVDEYVLCPKLQSRLVT